MKPSVTQILDYFYGDWKKHVEPEALEKARKYGTEWHKIIEKALRCEERPPEVAPMLHYLDTFRKQLGDIVHIEKRFETEDFSGKPDLITEHAIIDWKTGITNKEMIRLQMAGYHVLVTEAGLKPQAWIAYNIKTKRAYNLYDKRAVKKFHKLLKLYKEEAYEY